MVQNSAPNSRSMRVRVSLCRNAGKKRGIVSTVVLVEPKVPKVVQAAKGKLNLSAKEVWLCCYHRVPSERWFRRSASMCGCSCGRTMIRPWLAPSSVKPISSSASVTTPSLLSRQFALSDSPATHLVSSQVGEDFTHGDGRTQSGASILSQSAEHRFLSAVFFNWKRVCPF